MSQIDDLMAQLPLDQIAARLGVDRAQAESATRTALPALLGGLHANAQDPAAAASLTGALQQHDDAVLGSGLDAVDPVEGQKIVGHIFGDQTGTVVDRLGGVTAAGVAGPGLSGAGGGGGAAGSAMVQQLLPLLAPYVMAYVAKRLGGGGALGGILGGILGGSAGSPAGGGAAGGGLLGDVLGGLLGRGRR